MGRKKIERKRFICLNCGNKDYVLYSQVRNRPTAGKFCTKKCHFEFYQNNPEKHPLCKGWSYSRGYLSGKRKDINGKVVRILQHRYLMEKKIGRKLTNKEHVHHINGVKDDNRIENLIILTHSDHTKMTHANTNKCREALSRGREKMKEIRKNNKWARKYDECIICGKIEHKHQAKGKCTRCYLGKHRLERFTFKWVF